MKPTLEDQLGSYFSALSDQVIEHAREARPTETRQEPPPSRAGRWRAAIAVAACLSLLAVIGSRVLSDQPRDETVFTNPASIPEATSTSPSSTQPGGVWHQAKTSMGFIGEGSPTVVWTGQVVLILYAENAGSDQGVAGMILNPTSLETTPIAASPLGWRARPAVAWTAGRLHVFGGASGPGIDTAGAAYDPATNSWQTLAPPPGFVPGRSDPLAGGAASVGDQIIFWAAALAYSPRTDQWSTLPRAPLSPRTNEAVTVVGDRLIVWGGCRNTTVDCAEQPASWLHDGAIYDTTARTWHALPASPLASGPAATAVPHDDQALVASLGVNPANGPTVAVFDPVANTWTVRPSPPAAMPLGSSLTMTNTSIVVIGNGTTTSIAAALDLSRDTWQNLAAPAPGRRFHATTWTGQALVLAGGFPQGTPLIYTDPSL